MNKTIKQCSIAACLAVFLLSCNKNDSSYSKDNSEAIGNPNKIKDTLSYAYKATYSSDIAVPSHPEYAQKVLMVWKMFEAGRIDDMRQYYADTVTYETSSGYRFHGKAEDLLNFARKDIEGLDSLRFDVSMWQSLHINDRNEDWVYVWAAERRYAKDGTADTSLIHEQWKIENGKVAYFNEYTKSPVKR